jgi:hypothetical protein
MLAAVNLFAPIALFATVDLLSIRGPRHHQYVSL